MAKAGVHCIKPEYIAMYLSDIPLPSPSANYIPQVLPFLRSAVLLFCCLTNNVAVDDFVKLPFFKSVCHYRQQSMMDNVVNVCLSTKFEGGLQSLQDVKDVALICLGIPTFFAAVTFTLTR